MGKCRELGKSGPGWAGKPWQEDRDNGAGVWPEALLLPTLHRRAGVGRHPQSSLGKRVSLPESRAGNGGRVKGPYCLVSFLKSLC